MLLDITRCHCPVPGQCTRSRAEGDGRSAANQCCDMKADLATIGPEATLKARWCVGPNAQDHDCRFTCEILSLPLGSWTCQYTTSAAPWPATAKPSTRWPCRPWSKSPMRWPTGAGGTPDPDSSILEKCSWNGFLGIVRIRWFRGGRPGKTISIGFAHFFTDHRLLELRLTPDVSSAP